MPGQETSTLTYNRTDVTPVTVATEYRYSSDNTNGNKQKIEQFMSLSNTAVTQITTITIAAGSVGNAYVVVITCNGVTKAYRYDQVTGDTAAPIADSLAALIGTHPGVAATVEGNVISVSACIAGIGFTATNTGSTTPANVVIATTTANAGTPKHRKRWEVVLNFIVNAQGFEQLLVSGVCYSGAEPPVSTVTFGPLLLSTAQASIATVQSTP